MRCPSAPASWGAARRPLQDAERRPRGATASQPSRERPARQRKPLYAPESPRHELTAPRVARPCPQAASEPSERLPGPLLGGNRAAAPRCPPRPPRVNAPSHRPARAVSPTAPKGGPPPRPGTGRASGPPPSQRRGPRRPASRLAHASARPRPAPPSARGASAVPGHAPRPPRPACLRAPAPHPAPTAPPHTRRTPRPCRLRGPSPGAGCGQCRLSGRRPSGP